MIIYNHREKEREEIKMSTGKVIFEIYRLLQEAGLNWYGYKWWGLHSDYLNQFNPKDIDYIAQKMAEAGMIETNNHNGYCRKGNTPKEIRRIKKNKKLYM